MKGRWLTIGVSIVLILPVLSIGWNCSSSSESKHVNPQDTAHYVGISVCGSCHQDILSTFSHTGMGSSFSGAMPLKSTADFSRSSFYDAKSDMTYLAYRQSGHLFIKEFKLSGKDTLFSRTEAIDYIVGSGQHTHSHLFKEGKYIYQAPMTWYAQQAKWDLPPGFEVHNSHYNRMIDVECMSCHNAMPVMAEGSDRRFVSLGNGIDCERCHGPGSEHVRIQQTSPGKFPDQHGNYIVNPSKLSWQRLTDVCQRCHLQGNNVLKPGKSFTDFKPGMKLSDVFEIYLPLTDGEEPFDMANHAARLQKSKCFIAGKGKLTCISCHNPHVSVKVTGQETFNSSCRGCHTGESCKEDKSIQKAASFNCVKCHMPAQGTEDIPHVTVHDHRIGVHKNMSGFKPGKPIGLYAVNNPNPDKTTLAKAYLSYYEKFDQQPIYRQLALKLLNELNDPELWIHYYYQSGEYRKVAEARKNLKEVKDDLTAYRLGKSYERLNKKDEASIWFRKTLELKNDRPEYYADYVSICISRSDYIEASKWLDYGLREFPKHATLLNGKGYLNFLEGRYAEAKKFYLRALDLFPDNISVLENLVLLYTTVNDRKKAEEYLLKILKIDSGHLKAKQALMQIREN